MGKHLAINMVKNLFIVLQKSTTDVIKTASKRAIQKTAEATGDLMVTKLLIKLQVSRKSSQRTLKNQKMIKLMMH